MYQKTGWNCNVHKAMLRYIKGTMSWDVRPSVFSSFHYFDIHIPISFPPIIISDSPHSYPASSPVFRKYLRENATICETAVGLIHEIKNDKKYRDAVPLNDYTLYKLTPLQRPVYTELWNVQLCITIVNTVV